MAFLLPWMIGFAAAALAGSAPERPAATAATVESPAAVGESPAAVAAELDRLLAVELGFGPAALAPPIGDAVFLRRAYLDLVGTIPMPEEVRRFLRDPAKGKRAALVDRLVDDRRYALTQARYWRDVVFSRRSIDRSLAAAPTMVRDLADWIDRGEGWDAIATRFITATGSARTDGATAILMAQDGQTEDVAAEVSRVFLGVQIQCAQCHDHPWDDWSREQFHELAAFFPRVGVRPKRDAKPRDFVVQVNDRPDRPAMRRRPNANRRGSPEHYMPNLEDPTQPAERITPRFFFTSLTKPIGTPDAERRGSLATDLASSDWFAIALVNRYWSELIGEGFYEPVDDLGPDRDATARPVVERLAEAFVTSGYDLRWLHRTILATEAYARESRPRRAPGETPMTANVAQPLRGDQLFDATLAALGVDEKQLRGVQTGLVRGGGEPRAAFVMAFGYDPSDPRSSVQTNVPQTLALMNTPALNRAVRATSNSALGRLRKVHAGHPERLIDALYLRTLSRGPTEEERRVALAHLASYGRPTLAAEDLLWALINSAEFSHRR